MKGTPKVKTNLILRFMKRFLSIALFAVLALPGCSDSDDGPGAASRISVAASGDPISLSSDAQITPEAESITVECLKNSGNPDFRMTWKLASNQPWLKLALDPGGSDAAQQIEGEATRTVYLVVEENPDTGGREATVTLNDESTPAVTVSQTGFRPGTVAVTPADYPALTSDAHRPAATAVTVTCLRYNGDPDPLAAWSLASDKPWLTLTLNADGSQAATELEGAGTQQVYLVAEENTDAADRTAQIRLSGGAEPVLAITQARPVVLPPLPLPEPGLLDGIDGAGQLPSTEASYVGVFWRAGQIGERVIRSDAGGNAGAWTATVAWYDGAWNPAAGDGVVLAAGDSTDPNIRTDNPGDAEGFPVGGTLASVGGTVDAEGFIVFRIGLTRAYRAYDADTAPARYAVVLLTYADGARRQKIFLRQGEGADYVMRPGDKDGRGADVADNRSFARRFMPYNLTASDAQWASQLGGATVDAYPQVAVQGGSLVRYPTQGGGIFQGQASSAAWLRRVFSHTYEAAPSGLSRYSGDENWDAATNETCPPGYRRVRDGAVGVHTALEIAGSEMRQSIWLNPLPGQGTTVYDLDNSAWGFYADGFFDRRPVQAGAVSPEAQQAAYMGRMFFNPTTHASLFFPVAGYRTTGVFQYAGSRAYYWAGTTITANTLSCIYISNTRASPYRQDRGYSWSIRCVRDSE